MRYNSGFRLLLPLLAGCALAHAGIAAAQGAAPAAEAAMPPPVPTVATIDGIGPVGEWRKLGGGYVLSEGPAATARGDVYFADFRGGAIYRIDSATMTVSPFMTGINAGGLAFDRDGRMITLEGRTGEVLKIDTETKARTVIAAGYAGKRFNAPNDLVLDRQGGFYFSDPSNGAPLPLPQGRQSIFYVTPKGETRLLVDYIPRPNGLALSRDGKMLYAVLSGDTQILQYRIKAPGRIDPVSGLFADLAFQPPVKRGESANSGGDGLKADANGNLYVAGRFGIEVFAPDGKPLGIIATPERPSNLVFGGPDRRTLFVTTYQSIYAVDMAAQGLAAPR